MTTATISKAEVIQELSRRIGASKAATRATANRRGWMAVAGVAALALTLAGAKYSTMTPAPKEKASAPANPQVSVTYPTRSKKDLELQLPAEAQAYQTTTLFARIRGYLKSWEVDRGARVKAGQVLARIDTPDFDQQVRQAEADLKQGIAQLEQSRAARDQAKANVEVAKAQVELNEAVLKLAEVTAVRFKDLVDKNAASQQQYDETMNKVDTGRATLASAKADVLSKQAALATSESAINTAEARVNSLRASLNRLKETEVFKTIVAPFDGTITARFLDVGALVPDDGSKALFTIIQDDVLRIAVNVPQTYALEMREGNSAKIIIRELPRRDFTARITRTSRAIDPAARTLLVELELDNRDGAVISGAFIQVKFELSSQQQPLMIPTSTLKMTKEGPTVAIVDRGGRIHFQKVELGRDHGAAVEVASGLGGGEALVINPAEILTEGTAVEMLRPDRQVAAK
jgi:RND family efflux transporter MFP subunit